MNSMGIIFFLCLCILVLCGIVWYQQFAFRTGTQAKLRSIHEKMKEIDKAMLVSLGLNIAS